MAQLANGVVAFELGRWAEARRRSERAEQLFREGCIGVVWETTTAQLFRMSALYQLGELGEMQSTLPALIQAADARGDLYASVTFRIRQLNMVLLAADNPDGARQAAEDAMRLWNPAEYLSQHYYHLVAMTNADLYEGKGAAAMERLAAGWKAVERSLFTRVQVIRVEALHLRGRAALMAWASGGAGDALRRAGARRCATVGEGERSLGDRIRVAPAGGRRRERGRLLRRRHVAGERHPRNSTRSR